jgi:DNA-directed RNA polymerase specialized sigma24 family protein
MTRPPTDRAADLARHRDHLVGIAYRLLGSVDEAEDVVQDVLAPGGRRRAPTTSGSRSPG